MDSYDESEEFSDEEIIEIEETIDTVNNMIDEYYSDLISLGKELNMEFYLDTIGSRDFRNWFLSINPHLEN